MQDYSDVTIIHMTQLADVSFVSIGRRIVAIINCQQPFIGCSLPLFQLLAAVEFLLLQI